MAKIKYELVETEGQAAIVCNSKFLACNSDPKDYSRVCSTECPQFEINSEGVKLYCTGREIKILKFKESKK